MMVLLTNTGAVVKKVIEVTENYGMEALEKVANLLNERLEGFSLGRLEGTALENLGGDVETKTLLRVISAAALEAARAGESKLLYGGASRLLSIPEFRDVQKLRMLLEFLEEEKFIAELLQKTLSSPGLQVSIGSENHFMEMKDCAMITATYQVRGIPLGSLGIIGPMRMPYRNMISIVNYVAESFSEKLNRIS